MIRIALFDYGAGNLHSLAKGIEAGGGRVTVTTDWDQALALDALVLPGVGSFGAAVSAIEGHEARVREALRGGHPCLGICLGMQLLMPESEEGSGTGIGLVEGRVRRLRARTVPQMGWNDVTTPGVRETGPVDPLFQGVAPAPMYYANSFICEADEPETVIAESEYEGERYAAAIRRARTWGVQFHPEKSSSMGLRLLTNFVRRVKDADGPTAESAAGRTAERAAGSAGATQPERDTGEGS